MADARMDKIQRQGIPAHVGAAKVFNNDWTRLADVPQIGLFEPTLSVSVVIPYYNRRRALALTLAGLVEQSYPRSLIEVIVVDDGSDAPPEIPSSIAKVLPVEVIHQERQGFGTPRARNTGVQVASGELIVFLDCDMIPEREHIEAHARWHHAASDVVTIGRRVHAEFEGVTLRQIRAAIRSDSLGVLMADRDPVEPEWITRYLDSTASLTNAPDDYWRVMSGGNLAVPRALYEEVGGSDESFNQWGGEDNELGYRLVQTGALVVPEPRAKCWHQGQGHVPDRQELASLRMQRTKMRNLIADREFRGNVMGRSYTNPYAAVTVLGEGCSAEQVGRCVDTVLASDMHDLVVLVVVPEDSLEAEWFRREYADDGRVFVDSADSGEERFKWSPVRVRLPASALLLPGAFSMIVEAVSNGSLGVLHLTVPNSQDERSVVHAANSRALRRSRRLAADGMDPSSALSAYFGEQWDLGSRFGVASNGEDTQLIAGISRSHADPERVDALVDEMHALEVTIADRDSRRALQVANDLGLVSRARSGDELRLGMASLWASIRAPQIIEARGREEAAKDFLRAFKLS